MRAGAKVGLLATALAAIVAAAFWAAQEPDDPGAGTPLPPPTAAAPRPRRAPPRHAEKPKPSKDELDDDDAAAPKRASAEFKLAGHVVDADGKPVEGGLVRAIRPDGASVEAKTAADGKFALACGPRPRFGSIAIGVSATAGASRAAFLAYELFDDAPDEDDVGPLALSPAIALIARVVDAKGPVAGARVFLGSFFGTVFAAATADARGVARFDSSPPADAWLFAYAKGRGRARGEIPDKRDPRVPLVLTLTARTVRVVVVRTPPDEPLAGEAVSARLVTDDDETRLYSEFVPQLDVAPTAADGSTSIEDVAVEDAVELRCAAPAHPDEPWRAARRPANPVVVNSRAVDARIEFPAGRTIRWRIAEGETAPPAPGALVSLKPALSGVLPPGPAKLKVENGDLVGAGFGTVALTALAVADDGAVASIGVDATSERGPDAVFRRPRRVSVSLGEDGGGPIAGAEISLKTEDDRGRPVGESVATGADGRAEIAGLDPGVGRLAVFESSGKPADVRRIGVVDVTAADAKLDAKLPAVRAVTIRVTTDGERKLPAGWKLLVDSTWTDAAEADESAGEIRFSARAHAADRSLSALLRADGYRDVSVSIPAGVAVADASFDRGVTIVADVRRSAAAWNPFTAVESWSDDARSWRVIGGLENMSPRVEPDGGRRIEHLAPGRYRLWETSTGTASAPVDLNLGDPPATLVLDLTRAGFVSGRVLGPDDQPVAGAWILVDDPSAPSPQPNGHNQFAMGRAMSRQDGVFTVLVPGDRTVRVRASHPLMKADSGRDFVDVVEPRDGIVLRLVDGPIIEFTAPGGVGQRQLFSQHGPVIQLFHGPAAGDPVAQLPFDMSQAPKLRAGGFEPGRYTVWIELGNGAPVTLADVELKDGVTDLGEIRPAAGSAVRVHVTFPAGEAAQMVTVVVVRQDAPTYSRVAMSKEGEVVVAGLGPGRFDVRANVQGARREDAFKRTVDLDGERDVVIDYAPK